MIRWSLFFVRYIQFYLRSSLSHRHLSCGLTSQPICVPSPHTCYPTPLSKHSPHYLPAQVRHKRLRDTFRAALSDISVPVPYQIGRSGAHKPPPAAPRSPTISDNRSSRPSSSTALGLACLDTSIASPNFSLSSPFGDYNFLWHHGGWLVSAMDPSNGSGAR